MRRYDGGVIVGDTDPLPVPANWVRSEIEHARKIILSSQPEDTAYVQGRLGALMEMQMMTNSEGRVRIP